MVNLKLNLDAKQQFQWSCYKKSERNGINIIMKQVAVLMSTYNGEKYITTQIESVLNQTGVNIKLLVRDDGSTDKTISILKQYEKEGKLNWYTGENLKPAKSFMNLIKNAPDADYYAFSDQDDYWKPEKLSRAVNILNTFDLNKPALYYSNTTLVDKNLKELKDKPAQRGPFTKVGQVVIGSNATGCTMCFNKELLKMVQKYEPSYQIMHDGWVHKICVVTGGNVFFDKKSYILYRQHDNNVVGGTSNIKKRWKERINNLVQPTYSRSRGIQELVKGYSEFMPKYNLEICSQVANYRINLKNRIKLLANIRIKTGDSRIDLMYRMAVILGIF